MVSWTEFACAARSLSVTVTEKVVTEMSGLALTGKFGAVIVRSQQGHFPLRQGSGAGVEVLPGLLPQQPHADSDSPD
jgi:hypothetical protein